MIEMGIQARCDRCGQNKFYSSNGIIPAKTMMESDCWEERLGKTLCCECASIFDEMTEKFFNEI